MDNEVKGEGNSVNYKYRMHDPRVGRFFAVDPLIKQYPWYTPYSFSGNKVIRFIELEGEEEVDYLEKFKYDGLYDYYEVLPNVGIGLINSVNVIWNSGVATTKKIYHDGFISYGNALDDEIVQAGKGIVKFADDATSYHANTPVRQQLIDAVSPQVLEQTILMGAEAYVGSKSFIGPRLPVKNVAPVISTVDDVVEGGAKVIKFEETPGNRFGHYAIETNVNGTKLATEQVGSTSTTISELSYISNRADVVEINLPKAATAQKFQKNQIGEKLGKYDQKCNSCQTHVGNVLREGGVDVPTSYGQQYRFIKGLFDNQ